MKRGSLFLLAVLVLCAVPAFADEPPTGTITVEPILGIRASQLKRLLAEIVVLRAEVERLREKCTDI